MDWVFVRLFFSLFFDFLARVDTVDSMAFACVGYLMCIPVWMQAVLSEFPSLRGRRTWKCKENQVGWKLDKGPARKRKTP